jgi:hypothetical protein
MNGFALLVALSSLGVDYNVQKSEDGKLEYVIQIEPEFLRSLSEGQQIHSDVPPEAGAIERVLVRVGTTAARHSQPHIAEYRRLLVSGSRIASAEPGRIAPDAAAAIVWPAKSKPELNYNVTSGFEPAQSGVLAYYVQINSTLLQSLQAGDEVRAAVDPAAGKVGRFVILAGDRELPKIPVEPVATIAPPTGVASGRHGAPAFGAGAAASTTTSNTQLGFGAQPGTAPPVDRTLVPLASTPDYRTQDYGSPPATAEQPLYGPRGGRFGGVSDVATDPAATAPQGYGQPLAPSYAGGRFAEQQPPVDYGHPPAGYVAQTGGQQAAQLPPQLPPRTNAYAPANSSFAQPPVDDRLASRTAPLANTSPLPAPQINPASTTKAASDSSASESRWMPLMFTVFALFLSIGGNLYLGWTAAEFYSRYRLATERLRSAGR